MQSTPDIPQSNHSLLQVAAGNEAAFTTLVNNYAGVLYTVAFRYLESRELAEEIVQDIFVQVWQSRESLAQIRNFRTYLYVLCRNHAVNALKKLLTEQKHIKEHRKVATQDEEPDNQIEKGLGLIDEAVEILPASQRQAWIMSRRQAKTYQEIAEEMNISRETVKTHIQRANEAIIKHVTRHMDLWLLIILSKKIF